MSVNNWLISRCTGSGCSEMKHLYASYKLECTDNGEMTSCTARGFTDAVVNIFPGVKRKKVRQGSKTKNMYFGIELKPLGPLRQKPQGNADIKLVANLLPDSYTAVYMTCDTFTCECNSNFVSNGNVVKKTVMFKTDYTFQVRVGETVLNLKELDISNNYELNKAGISDVCSLISRLKLCCGIEINKDIVCSRMHTIEQLKDNTTEITSRRLRSVMCCRAVAFCSRTSTCKICQRMTIVQNTKTETKSSTSSTKVTKDDFRKLIPEASEAMLELLFSQSENAGRNPKQRRWSKEMITTCLQIYTRSPHVYKLMRDSNLLILPSPTLLIAYKNKVKQGIGFSDEIFRWMHAEARRLELPSEGWTGGIILDEMAIQEDIQICNNGDMVHLVGLEDVGNEGNACNTLRKGANERAIGSHVLQFMFLGVSGFRFPFAHFTTTNVQSYHLYSLFWLAVRRLNLFGFSVAYVSMDGVISNRAFMNVCLGKNPDTMISKNPSPFDDEVVFIMDSSHVIKKIRNNIIKSGITKGCTRILTLPNGDIIQWQMWLDVYRWDQCNALKIHRKLTNEHIFPSSQNKMRNHLAEEVLNSDMLHLFRQYQATLSNAQSFNGVTELLSKTSCMIDIFSDRRPILSVEDYRLGDIKTVLSWFTNWQAGVDNSKQLMSVQCMEDIKSCLLGFYELCCILLNKKSIQIIPAMVNSDVLENHFCQQRATFNGANANPTALQYSRNLNSIILSESLVSHKANAGKSSIKSPSLAFTSAPKKVMKRPSVHSVQKDEYTKIKVKRL